MPSNWCYPCTVALIRMKMKLVAQDTKSIVPGGLKGRWRPPWVIPANKALGFTLIELMLVFALIGILASLASLAFNSYRERAKVAACVAEIRVIEKNVLSYYINENQFPDSLADVGLDQVKDPWHNPYQYLKILGAQKNVTGNARKDHFLVPINSDFDLYSKGPDGQSKTPLTAPVSADDIIRANDGEFVGRASLY